MSTGLSTYSMVAEVIQRCRFGVDSNFAMARLNQAFRWVSQNGAWVWEQRLTSLTVLQAAQTTALPVDIDPGKPMFISGPSAVAINIPFVPFDKVFNNQLFYSNTASPGMYSAWTHYTNFTAAQNGTAACVISNATITFASGTAFSAAMVGQSITINSLVYTITAFPTSTTLTISPAFVSASATYSYTTSSFYAYTLKLFPAAAAPGSGGFTLPFVYHAQPVTLTMGEANFFPSPSEFDDVIIQIAEGEAKRIYTISGWSDVLQQGQAALAPLKDKYRSDKSVILGMGDQVAATQEAQAQRAE